MKKVALIVEKIKSNRLEVLQAGCNDLKKKVESPKNLIGLIEEVLKKRAIKTAQIEFNKKAKKFLLSVDPLNVNADNTQLLINLKEQVSKLKEFIEQHEFIKVLDEMISELEFCKSLQQKSQELVVKHLDQNRFIEATFFVNNNGDNNINLFLDLIDPNTHVCIINTENASKILDIFCSILLEKDVKKTEACFPLLNKLIQNQYLNIEHLEFLRDNLTGTSAKGTLSLVTQQLDSKKQQTLEDDSLKEVVKAFPERQGDAKVQLLITDIIAIMCADNKRSKKNYPIDEKLCEKIIDKYIEVTEYTPPKNYKAELLRLMQRKENKKFKDLFAKFKKAKEESVKLETPNQEISLNKLLNYLLSEAIKMTHVELVKFLLKEGANPEIVDAQGNTLLHLAARNNQSDQTQKNILELRQILINKGVDEKAKNKEGRTLLEQAIDSDQQYLKNFSNLNYRPDAAKRIKVNLSNGTKKLIVNQQMVESDLRKVEKGRHPTLNNSDIPELVRAWKIITNFDQRMYKIEIENDEVILNDYLKDFEKEYKEAKLNSLKELYANGIKLTEERLKQNLKDMPMQESPEQDELASSLTELMQQSNQN